jgi:hypothetical protein
MKMASKPCPPPSSFDTSPSQSSGTEEIEESLSQSAIDTTGSPMERIIASLTLEAIETYINNKGFMDRAQSMLTGIQDPLIFIDSSEQSIEISGKVQSSSANTCAVTISLEKSADEHYELLQGHCPCLLGKTQGKCKHCGALLLYIQSNPTNINMETGDLLQRKQAYYSRTGMSSVQHERGYSSQDSQASSSKKRSYNSSLEEEGNTSESSSKKRSSHSQQSSASIHYRFFFIFFFFFEKEYAINLLVYRYQL